MIPQDVLYSAVERSVYLRGCPELRHALPSSCVVGKAV